MKTAEKFINVYIKIETSIPPTRSTHTHCFLYFVYNKTDYKIIIIFIYINNAALNQYIENLLITFNLLYKYVYIYTLI